MQVGYIRILVEILPFELAGIHYQSIDVESSTLQMKRFVEWRRIILYVLQLLERLGGFLVRIEDIIFTITIGLKANLMKPKHLQSTSRDLIRIPLRNLSQKLIFEIFVKSHRRF